MARPKKKASTATKPPAPPVTVPRKKGKEVHPGEALSAPKNIPLNLQPRAGAETYADEVAERIKDVQDTRDNGDIRPVYILPIGLGALEYEALLMETAKEGVKNSDFTERDMLEKLIRETESYAALTREGKTA